ncbi:MAG: uncharacterized protein K0S70_243 [Microbacterium sp.]|jgi:hypothetical protein|nr:uncharacterized protein [Microbacterium sp.]
MPVPLIVAGVLAAASLGGAAVAAYKKLAGKRVAVLGGQRVGKTTLLHVLRSGTVPLGLKRTLDPAEGGKFSIDSGSGAVGLSVPKDLPGNDGLGYADWREAFERADYVWYLFRADLIERRDPEHSALVKEHLAMFRHWMKTGHSPTVILIGSWSDQAPGFASDPELFRRDVAGANPISVGAVSLNNAKLVVGALSDDDTARVLIANLGDAL